MDRRAYVRWLTVPLLVGGVVRCAGGARPPVEAPSTSEVPATAPESHPSAVEAPSSMPASRPGADPGLGRTEAAAEPSEVPGLRGRFVLGEAVVVLRPGATPPEAVGEARCEPRVWADARTVVLRCDPIEPGPEGTQALADALAEVPGVEAAHPNMIREDRR